MHIGIDVRPLQTGHKYRGIGRYAYGRLKALKKIDFENQYFLYIDNKLGNNEWIKKEFSGWNFKVKELSFSFPLAIEKLLLGAATTQVVIPLETRKDRLDIFYSFEYFVPCSPATKFVITVYGLNPFSIDKAKRFRKEKKFELDKAHSWRKYSLKKLRDFFFGRLIF